MVNFSLFLNNWITQNISIKTLLNEFYVCCGVNIYIQDVSKNIKNEFYVCCGVNIYIKDVYKIIIKWILCLLCSKYIHIKDVSKTYTYRMSLKKSLFKHCSTHHGSIFKIIIAFTFYFNKLYNKGFQLHENN